MLIKIKMPTIVGILTFMSMIHFMISWGAGNEKGFLTLRPGYDIYRKLHILLNIFPFFLRPPFH